MDNLKITLDLQGSKKYTKASYPIRYGRYSEIKYDGYQFLFNNNGEIKHIAGTGADWPHPAEWLKRTIGNDWVYYSTGSYYTGVIDLFGEYYLPCPSYPTNNLFKEKPFARQSVAEALNEFEELCQHLSRFSSKETGKADIELQNFMTQVIKNTQGNLHKKSDLLHRILKAKVSVLPPDCRHVDYDVMPLMITDGCMYNCSFCEVKSGVDLSCRSRSEIEEQLYGLKNFFGTDLSNYNSIYLGQHDALSAQSDDIIFVAEQAYELLGIKQSIMQGANLFLFGSAESFLQKEEDFWKRMNRLPFYTYVNIGLESFDDETLEFLKKPVSSEIMQKAFKGMLAINKSLENIEVTANFLLGEDLPANHIPSIVNHIERTVKGVAGKGCIYISPLKGSKKTKELLNQFRAMKQKIHMQTFLYLIQRL